MRETADGATARATAGPSGVHAPSRPYNAFLSYSHAADGRLAPALQRALQRFAKPWWRRHALRVFRDQTSLSANPALWPSIQEALDESAWFILMASPAAGASPWVNREIQHWLASKSADRILIAVTEGVIRWDAARGDFDRADTNAIPAALWGAFQHEPLYVDMRWIRSAVDIDDRHPRFRDQVADLAATLHGRPKDDLVGEDVVQHRRTVRTAWSVAVTVAATVLAASTLAVVAVRQRDARREQEARALEEERRADAATSEATVRAAVSEAIGNTDQLDLALLLAVAASDLEDGGLTRATLASTLRANPALVRHMVVGGDLFEIAISGDDALVATGGRGGLVHVYEVATGRAVGEPRDVCPENVAHLEFLPATHVLGVACLHAAAALLDLDAGTSLRLVSAEGAVVLAFSPDAASLYAGTTSGSIFRLSPVDGAVLAGPAAGQSGAVAGLVARVDVLASASVDGSLALRDPTTLEVTLLVGPEPSRGAAYAVDLSPDGSLLAGGYQDGEIVVFDRAGMFVSDATGYSESAFVAFANTGELIAVSPAGPPSVYNPATGADVGAPFVGEGGVASNLAVSPSGLIATPGRDGTVILWRLAARNRLLAAQAPQEAVVHHAVAAETGRVVVGGQDSALSLYGADLATPPVRAAATGGVTSIASTAAGLVVSTIDGAVSLHEAADGTLVATLGEHGGAGCAEPCQAYRVVAIPPGELAASLGDDGIRLWDAAARATVGGPFGPSTAADVAVDVSGTLLAVADAAEVSLWSVPSGTQAGERVVGDEAASTQYDAVAFAPDGSLAAGRGDGNVFVWSAGGAPTAGPLTGPAGAVSDVAFSPDGALLAVADFAGTVNLWETATWTRLGTLRPSDRSLHSVYAISFAPDGAVLYTVGADGIVRGWAVSLDAWRATACDVAGRNLSPAEWEHVVGDIAPYRAVCPQWPAG